MKPNWFVALPVPAHHWLPGVLENLPSTCRGFHPSDVHMTLAFFGAMAPDKKQQVLAVMEGMAHHPFTIKLDRLLCLPSTKRVSALSFSVSLGGEAVCAFMEQWRVPLIEAACGRPDTRPPLAHITVARPLRKAGEQARRAARDWACEVLDRVALYTWSEDRRTRQFWTVHEQKLEVVT